MKFGLKQLLRGLTVTLAAALPLSASAGLLTFQGATFSSSWTGDVLTINIDADPSHLTGDWAGATSIDSIALNDVGTWTSVSDIMLDGPGTSFDHAINGESLDSNGCKTLKSSGSWACWSGFAALADNMVFAFSFQPGVANHTDTPDLKVRFLDASGDKQGSLLSKHLGVSVPEPSTLALFGLALLGLVFAVRKRPIG